MHPTFKSAPVRGIPKSSDQDTSPCPPVKYQPSGAALAVANVLRIWRCDKRQDFTCLHNAGYYKHGH